MPFIRIHGENSLLDESQHTILAHDHDDDTGHIAGKSNDSKSEVWHMEKQHTFTLRG